MIRFTIEDRTSTLYDNIIIYNVLNFVNSFSAKRLGKCKAEIYNFAVIAFRVAMWYTVLTDRRKHTCIT